MRVPPASGRKRRGRRACGVLGAALPGARLRLHSSRARPRGRRVVRILGHFPFVLPVGVGVVNPEALVVEGRQQRPGGIAAAHRRGRRPRRHRLRPRPAVVRREDGEGARGRPRPGRAVSREPGVGKGPGSPPPPRRPHRARQVQTGRAAAAATCSPSSPRARRAWPIRAGADPALPWRRVAPAPALCGLRSAASCARGRPGLALPPAARGRVDCASARGLTFVGARVAGHFSREPGCTFQVGGRSPN